MILIRVIFDTDSACLATRCQHKTAAANISQQSKEHCTKRADYR